MSNSEQLAQFARLAREGSVRFDIRRSRAWLVQSRQRFNESRPHRGLHLRKVRAMLLLGLVVTGAILVTLDTAWSIKIAVGLLWLGPVALAGLAVAFVPTLLMAMWLLQLWSDRRDSNLGQHARVELNSEGMRVGEGTKLTPWREFNEVCGFGDGVLLRRGQRSLVWLPFEAIVEGTPDHVLAVLRASPVKLRMLAPPVRPDC